MRRLLAIGGAAALMLAMTACDGRPSVDQTFTLPPLTPLASTPTDSGYDELQVKVVVSPAKQTPSGQAPCAGDGKFSTLIAGYQVNFNDAIGTTHYTFLGYHLRDDGPSLAVTYVNATCQFIVDISPANFLPITLELGSTTQQITAAMIQSNTSGQAVEVRLS